jgi:hypothetical protein
MTLHTEPVVVTAEDGTKITINIPTGDMPTPERRKVLDAAFARVQNIIDWKLPIDRVVTVERFAEIDDIVEAIEFYTATSATVQAVHDPLDRKTFRVSAVGYYMGPAN